MSRKTLMQAAIAAIAIVATGAVEPTLVQGDTARSETSSSRPAASGSLGGIYLAQRSPPEPRALRGKPALPPHGTDDGIIL